MVTLHLELISHACNALERNAIVAMDAHIHHQSSTDNPAGCDHPIEYNPLDCLRILSKKVDGIGVERAEAVRFACLLTVLALCHPTEHHCIALRVKLTNFAVCHAPAHSLDMGVMTPATTRTWQRTAFA